MRHKECCLSTLGRLIGLATQALLGWAMLVDEYATIADKVRVLANSDFVSSQATCLRDQHRKSIPSVTGQFSPYTVPNTYEKAVTEDRYHVICAPP